ncbi:MAG: hypothetical protein ACOCRX_01435 [Candidatus Woesearchaeota archaeon]
MEEKVHFLILLNFEEEAGNWLRVSKNIDLSSQDRTRQEILSEEKNNILQDMKELEDIPAGDICVLEYC